MFSGTTVKVMLVRFEHITTPTNWSGNPPQRKREMTKIVLVTEPTVIPLFSMTPETEGLEKLVTWLKDYRPECLPHEGEVTGKDLFPHDGFEPTPEGTLRALTGNELLVELAGRNCYHSYGLKAGKKTNREYIEHSQTGTVPHRSIMYHAKMTFFLAGISRRVSHELIRHYVGSDRDEEGSPSQESTRYTFHPGHFVVPPRVQASGPEAMAHFKSSMESTYAGYLDYIQTEETLFKSKHGHAPKGIDRKTIYEAAAGYLPMQATTSLFWTANPVSLEKLFKERTDSTADAEFQKFACKWKKVCQAKWPNLFVA